MSEEPKKGPLNARPQGFVYRGINVESELSRLETKADGTIVPVHSWRAQGQGWVLFAPSTDAIKRAIDKRLDDRAAKGPS